ncbi:metallophosphoesterase [Legionella oakridgensis]|uniref:Uncharacterized protein n=2 Tax=Legionella oakridgensis TaxID=29423 RepID=W0BH82_9GAMM|nr:metallophosphoesterase [Legionella oakridgensis]AHE68086.1 hypothetical protein Loa_02549 [Legionella oakridgensis ATCC 33761 = DSM 21215]KTD44524.1 hypothetical protein Loak_0035 [Legionella oakridgensis]STY21065.1 Uncharacterised protein [Legionella longbeachae]
MRFFKPALQGGKLISHLTDIEGNWRYMQRWVDRSRTIQWQEGALTFRQPTKPVTPTFVYGGDFCDKGPGDLRIGTALTKFKAAHPTQVHLLAGNREIKCRRFTYELAPDKIRERLLSGPAAFWRTEMPPQRYVIQHMQQANPTASAEEVERYVSKLSTEQCQTLYLKWMLNETMGCGPFKGKPDTFEYRRMELAEISEQSAEQISDEMVTQSFIDSVAPTGVISNYLRNAQLGVVLGETLFLHGAVTPANIGYVPGLSESGTRIDNAKEWVEALNAWYKAQIEDWEKNPVEKKMSPPGHKPLDRYVLFNPQSVVTTNWYRNNQLAPISDEVVRFLNRAGIYRVVTGHQPFSDFPLIIRQPSSLEVIVGDTGYSDPNNPHDNRGQAIHNLEINEHGVVEIDAVRQDGSVIKQRLPSRVQVQMKEDIDLGHFTEDGRLIRLDASSQYVSSQLDGFAVKDEPLETPQSRLIQ